MASLPLCLKLSCFLLQSFPLRIERTWSICVTTKELNWEYIKESLLLSFKGSGLNWESLWDGKDEHWLEMKSIVVLGSRPDVTVKCFLMPSLIDDMHNWCFFVVKQFWFFKIWKIILQSKISCKQEI